VSRAEAAVAWGLLLGGFLAAWSVASATLPVPAYFLPPPTAVLASAGELVTKGILPFYVAESLRRIVTAALVALLVGVPLGLVLGQSRGLAAFFYPLLNFFQSVSGIAWLPLMLVWFGFGERTILVAVNYTVLFPVIFNALVGVRSVPRIYGDALRTLGASRWRILRDVVLPGALPSIATGMRLGLAYGWRALIAAEMLVRKGGLGDLIFGARTFGQIDRIITGMIVIGCLYVVIDRLIVQPIENLTVARWGVLRQ
jgi:NitT/TauT family transport system permease protein/taurine transport system permease protein